MSAVSIAAKPVPYQPKNKVRFVTATSLFDGHVPPSTSCDEFFNPRAPKSSTWAQPSVQEIVMPPSRKTCRDRDKLLPGWSRRVLRIHDRLAAAKSGDNIKLFGGGGGVIVKDEIGELMPMGSTICIPRKTARKWA